jgi:hypothetical protein
MNQFQRTILESVQGANAKLPRASRIKWAAPGKYYLSFDAWTTAKVIPEKGEEGLFAIQELAAKGFLKIASVSQPAPGGTERVDFLHLTELGAQKLLTLKLEQKLATV